MNDKLKLALTWKSLFHGALVAAGGAIGAALIQMLNDNHIPVGAEIKTTLLSGLSAGIAYLLKNALAGSSKPTNEDGTQ